MFRTFVALTASVMLNACDSSPKNCEAAVAMRAHADVELIMKSLYAGDVDGVLKYTHPTIVTLAGGQENARRAIEPAMATMKKNNMKAESLSFPAAPTCLKANGRRFVIVPTLSVVGVGEQRVESLNFQLGEMSSGAAEWGYVEGSRVNTANVQALFPGFPKDYKFPETYRKRL